MDNNIIKFLNLEADDIIVKDISASGNTHSITLEKQISEHYRPLATRHQNNRLHMGRDNGKNVECTEEQVYFLTVLGNKSTMLMVLEKKSTPKV